MPFIVFMFGRFCVKTSLFGPSRIMVDIWLSLVPTGIITFIPMLNMTGHLRLTVLILGYGGEFGGAGLPPGR